MTRLRTSLWWFCALLLATTAAVLVVRPSLESRVRSVAAVTITPATLDSVRYAKDTVAVRAVVNGNLFSPSRRAPRTRYVPDNHSTDASPTSAPSLGTDVASSPPAPTTLALLGTIAGPDGGSALVRLPGTREPRLMRVGEQAGAWRLTHVDDSSAALAGPAGSRRLTLRGKP